MPAQTVLIISKDKDFAQTVAEQVKNELGLSCQTAENNAKALAFMAQAALIVTSGADPVDVSCPVIDIKNSPIRLAQLLEDIAAQLQKPMSDTLVLPRGYHLNARQKQLAYCGKTADLTDKETQLLQSLLEAGNKGIAKEQLLKNIWGIEAALDTHTLETHIYRLRGKFRELSGDDEGVIEAIDGGYALK